MAAMVPRIAFRHNSDQRERRFGAFLQLSFVELRSFVLKSLGDFSYLIGWDWVT